MRSKSANVTLEDLFKSKEKEILTIMGLLSFIVLFFNSFFLVIIHELESFFAAKKIGITVHEFGFGLPHQSYKKYGETEYTINACQFGGFVRIEARMLEGYDSKSLQKLLINKKPNKT